ncbi:hypothetical protein VT930_21300, partial [Mycobacterium sherrisii]|uniref:hypothetical protein n=1 Tax=Mycobacterium sherrisii TaxID=243061 RepID=UPI002DDCEA51
PHHSPRIRVFLTSSVLPTKLTLGVSNQDQIHRYSDSPASAETVPGNTLGKWSGLMMLMM